MRKVFKCPLCSEWFNTTKAIMYEHYRTRHRPELLCDYHGELAFKLATITRNWFGGDY